VVVVVVVFVVVDIAVVVDVVGLRSLEETESEGRVSWVEEAGLV